MPDSLFFHPCFLHEAGTVASSMFTSLQYTSREEKIFSSHSPTSSSFSLPSAKVPGKSSNWLDLGYISTHQTVTVTQLCYQEVGGEVEFDSLFQNCITKRKDESPPKCFRMCSYQKKENEKVKGKKQKNRKQNLL